MLPVQTLTITCITAAALLIPATATADRHDVVGEYNVKFTEVADNCNNRGMNPTRATIKISPRRAKRRGATAISLSIPMIPTMIGHTTKDNRVRVRARKGPISIKGLQGRFAAAGRIDDGVLEMHVMADYFRNGEPYCTQSWSVSGLKKKRPPR